MPTGEPEDDRSQTVLKLGRDKNLAHRVLFGHRHPNDTPPFHKEIVDTWHSLSPRELAIVFRGGAKSTLAEEAIVLEACLRSFRNCIILGESETRAVERLRAIKHELNTNPYIEELFGALGEGAATSWTDARVVLGNGVCIQAHGRGQSLRGVKHLDQRPDLLFVDDLEDGEAVASPEARKKWSDWFFAVVLPALDPSARVRVAGTPLDPQALLENLSRDPRWHVLRVPIKYLSPEGEWVAAWPGRFPLAAITQIEAEMRLHGKSTIFAQEYMCQAEDPTQKAFTADMFTVSATVRTWQAVFAMYDPARTIKSTSATTGAVVYSWVANRLIVWEATGKRWRPDEIITDIFRVNDTYSPVWIGVEEDGLNEFILQPIRQEQIRRGYAIPFRALKAPIGKDNFIRSLQPFFKAREIIFDKPLPDLESQLLSFPTGDKDVPNALAYAPRLRPGVLVYDNFDMRNIVEGEMNLYPNAPVWLVLNATAQLTAAMLVQSVDGILRIAADWVRDGDPGGSLRDIVAAAGLEAGRHIRLMAGPGHFGTYDTVGLKPAVSKLPAELRKGGLEATGREEIRALLRKTVKGLPALLISTSARWTLNGFAGGYARGVIKGGRVSEFAEDSPYKVLLEGLESFAALLRSGFTSEEDQDVRYATAPDGRRYLTSRA